jgi:hypothetical protein
MSKFKELNIASIEDQEAISGNQVAAKAEPTIAYRSRNPETVSFEIQLAGQKFRPSRDKTGEFLIWDIPEALQARMEAHYHFRSSRVVPGDTKVR